MRCRKYWRHWLGAILGGVRPKVVVERLRRKRLRRIRGRRRWYRPRSIRGGLCRIWVRVSRHRLGSSWSRQWIRGRYLGRATSREVSIWVGRSRAIKTFTITVNFKIRVKYQYWTKMSWTPHTCPKAQSMASQTAAWPSHLKAKKNGSNLTKSSQMEARLKLQVQMEMAQKATCMRNQISKLWGLGPTTKLW